MTAYRTTEYVYSDDRLSLAQEIAEGLRARGLWVPQEWAGPDLITAVFRAIDARDAALVEALEGLCYSVSMRYGVSDGGDEEAFNDAERRHGSAMALRYLNARRALAAAKEPTP